MDLFGIGPLLTKLLAGAGALLAWKVNGALRERKGVNAGIEKARREQQEIDDGALDRARVSAARIAGADDGELDRVRREQAAQRERLVRRRG